MSPPREFCKGYFSNTVTFNKGKNEEWNVNVDALKKESVCGREGGDIIWWSEPFPEPGTLRHKSCLRAADKGTFFNETCSYCRSIPSIPTFYKRVYSLKNTSETEAHGRFDYCSREKLLDICRTKTDHIDSLESRIFLLKKGMERMRERRNTLKEKITEFAKSGKIGMIAVNLIKAHKDGKLKDKDSFLSMLAVTARNLNRKSSQGRRYDDLCKGTDSNKSFTKDYYYVLRAWGGPRLASFVALNNLGPSNRSISNWTKEKCYRFKLGVSKENIEHITYILKEAKKAHKIYVPVPCITAEDETRIIERVEYNQILDEAWGFCGERQDKSHKCQENFSVFIGNDNESYHRIAAAFENNKKAGYLRLVMINPINRKLPRLAIMMQGTCNTFTSDDVRSQWDRLCLMLGNAFETEVGPVIGHASDGDARRRKLMVEMGTSSEGRRYQPVPTSEGFVLSCRQEEVNSSEAVIRDLTDMDPIHNHKKLIRQISHATRVLKFAEGHFAHMNHIRLIFEKYPASSHGLQLEADIEQKDPQDWRSAQRLTFVRVQELLLEVSHKEHSALGTYTYLSIVWMYVEIFFSPCCPLKDRIILASTVINFFAIWRNFILKTKGLTIKDNFISRQTYQDILLSCHAAIMLICYFRDICPNEECPIDLMGTNCCEDTFSSLGNWIQGKHNYSMLDVWNNMSHVIRIQQLRSQPDGLLFPATNDKTEVIWPKQYMKPHPEKSDVLQAYPEKGEELLLWQIGVHQARDYAAFVGMCPESYKKGHFGPPDTSSTTRLGLSQTEQDPLSEWFLNPNQFKSLFEKTVISQMEDEREELIDKAICDEEAEFHSAEAICEGSSSEAETSDDEAVLSTEESSELLAEIDNAEGIQSNIHRVLDDLERTDVPEKTICPTVAVPNIGIRYKSTVINELNVGRKLSLDRLTRVRASTTCNKTVNEPRPDKRNVALFEDWAIRNSKEETGYVLGHIVRIRKKGKTKGFIDYTRPYELNDSDSGIEVIYQKYEAFDDAYQLGELHTISPKGLLCKVEMCIENGAFYIDECETDNIVLMLAKNEKKSKKPSAPREKITNPQNKQSFQDKSSRGRVRNRTFNLTDFIPLK